MESRLPRMALDNARRKYGAGWDRIGAEAQRNAIAYEALLVITSQVMEKYQPAVELAQSFFTVMPEVTR